MNTLQGRLDRCAINTATLGHREPLQMTIDRVARAGFGGIAPWRHEVEAADISQIARQIRALELKVTGYCRSTYFPAPTAQERAANIASNIRAVNDAATLGAECFVMVVGGLPANSRDLSAAREMVSDGIAALMPEARKVGVRLAIEPLHPMYAAERSVINTVEQALHLCRRLDPTNECLGIAVDVYHCWWDPQLAESVSAAGREARIAAYHVSDWLTPTNDMLLDRGMMGDGVIDLKETRRLVESAGYGGMTEVEIFSRDVWWKAPPEAILKCCAERLQSVC
ncbi:endonuclease [Burkholderia stagnalis]|uniref:Sugar phosphate isomerase/epimerase n=1 Tax=Burkholderia stagnalis TaxID=1503054 RepID=A0A6L3MNF5_9BURK|nr:sugar phosphate isomerase/epimerase family protein [Burkholderia stagnalis]KAB0632918.1 sugar phosphate isomerase/epimerase [Burkholderia stagnalis]KVO50855.1 endonuclease [Burkholderia stagnalis]KVO69046.1 endonuclease [Burkholderia stagnalis]KVW60386.1 endonuclease [Burkholderia stagnalis]KVW85265.1 endonuclease [Burkholderia stagnalis]